jgi:hypothetical protein
MKFPVNGIIGSRKFRWIDPVSKRLHTGIDILSLSGMPFNWYFQNNGFVVFNDLVNGYGSASGSPGGVLWIKTIIDNENYFIQFGHVLSNPKLKINSIVRNGDCLGEISEYLSNDPKKTGSLVRADHLHFSIVKSDFLPDFPWGYRDKNKFDEWFDPMQFLFDDK